MQRQTRTLILIAVIALVGVTALAMLAGRYRRMAPSKSVHDLPLPAEPAPEPAPEAQAAPEAPAEAAAPAPAPAEADTAKIAAEVEAFREARCGMKGVMDRLPIKTETIYREATNTTQGMDRVPMNPQLIIELRITRMKPLDAAGISGARYGRIREAYRRWKAATPSPEDAPYGAEFDRRKADLDPCDLGKYEIIDDLLKR